MSDHELTLVIQEEIARLPEKYRAAVVLCYLEGLTHEMAAEHLGWPVGSVKSRLAWARERLRVRLTRRGVAPTPLPFDRFESSKDAESVPAPVLIGTRLGDATVRGALKAGMGKGTLVGVVSAEAVALMEGFIRSMANSKLMVVAAVTLIAGLVTAGAGVVAHPAFRQENPARAGNPGPVAPKPVADAPASQGSPRPADAKPGADQGPIAMQVQVVDSEGHRLSGADVAVTVSYASNSGSFAPILHRVQTDRDGRAQLEVVRERTGAWALSANVWAFQPGHAIAVTSLSFARKRPSPIVIPLTLGQPTKCTITVVGQDDRPVAGLRLTPRLLRRTDPRRVPAVPEAWTERLAAITDARGVATLNYLPAIMVPLSVQVAGPGIAPHILPLEVPRGRDAIIKLGRPGRVVGIVRTASGEPVADVPVELWAQGADIRRNDFGIPGGDRRMTIDDIIRLDPQPLKTGPQGTFQTPASLLSGSRYRVSIRRTGFVPFVSDWVTLDGERVTIPPITLRPLRNLTGRIQDGQGRAVAGARVFLPAGGPSTATDPDGRFTLAGIDPGKVVILVERAGFRLQGRLVDPSPQAELGTLTVTRASEPPGTVMKPMADPIPPEESRALADRLLGPYLQDPMENIDVEARLYAILALSEFDLDRALELFRNGRIGDENRTNRLVRETLAVKLASREPARAEELVESITDPAAKAGALTRVVKALPASERGRKQALLERTTNLLRDRLPKGNDPVRVQLVSAIAEQWLDMGERDRARLVLQPVEITSDVLHTGYLRQLARLDPDQAMAQWQKQSTRSSASQRATLQSSIALELATDHPAEAERFFNLGDARDERSLSGTITLRLCRRLARVDPMRARRVADSLSAPGIRTAPGPTWPSGWARRTRMVLPTAIDRAIQEIDRLRESGPVPEPDYVAEGVLLMYSSNPAAAILPVVERVAPERLDEVFWAPCRFILGSSWTATITSFAPPTLATSACCWHGTTARWLPRSSSR